jgi:hydroxymethylpyrimidine/phosphomethylpyrimidine kinase
MGSMGALECPQTFCVPAAQVRGCRQQFEIVAAQGSGLLSQDESVVGIAPRATRMEIATQSQSIEHGTSVLEPQAGVSRRPGPLSRSPAALPRRGGAFALGAESGDPWHVLPRVLVIAGSDSGGGAGIQADIKTVTMLGGYAATAITALTAQNTLGVFGVLPIEPSFVRDQIRVVLDDIGADAIKTGMLHSREVIDAVASELEARAGNTPVIVDPVLVAKGGAALLRTDAKDALVLRLFPLAALITPNIPEAEVLTGLSARSTEDLPRLADALQALGASAVLVKGGHLPGDTLMDLLRTSDGEEYRFEGPRIQTRSSHGTGCTLASAIACGVAEGMTLVSAVERARRFVVRALETAPGLGTGHGPLNHGFRLQDIEEK